MELGYKVILPHAARDQGLRELYTLNVQASTLFPGLDGFAASLRLTLWLVISKQASDVPEDQSLGLISTFGFF
jgi:hypothetical protein